MTPFDQGYERTMKLAGLFKNLRRRASDAWNYDDLREAAWKAEREWQEARHKARLREMVRNRSTQLRRGMGLDVNPEEFRAAEDELDALYRAANEAEAAYGMKNLRADRAHNDRINAMLGASALGTAGMIGVPAYQAWKDD